jgi:dipeptidyl aminopeptidase/acylaminoacyl peptidase
MGMVPEDITRIKWVSDPQISPDGSRVAFVVTTLSAEKDEYLSNVWLADANGEAAPRRLTSGPKRDSFPRWSPDGARLAFVSEREPKKKAQLYALPLDGGEPVRLTDVKNGVSNPQWSPDGTRIAFLSRVGGWQEPEDEAERGKSKPARFITTLKYRLDNEGWIYDRRNQVFVVDADPAAGGEPKQLTEGDYDHADPTWSPDGSLIAFTSARHETRDEDNASDLWVVSPDGGEPRKITDTAGPVRLPVWGPRGRALFYLGHRDRDSFARNARLWTVPLEGGEPKLLSGALDRTCAPFFAAFRPAWVDRGTLLFAVEDKGDVPIYAVRPHDPQLELRRTISGDRSITGLSASMEAKRIAFTATDPINPAEVYVCDADGSNERQLTALNAEWNRAAALSTPEKITYERAGYTLDCWIMRPVGFEEGKTYPTLLNVHGGPATQYGHVFFDEFQVYAGAGYGVIFTNPRGSQGYGEDFMRAVLHDWGNNDYLDVMAGLNAAHAHAPWIDANRLGVMGGSYGGYVTSWTVGHTDRFKAACSERALNEFSSMFGTSDIGHTFPKEHVGAYPWDDRQAHIAHSPLTYAPQIKTPLLIMHAENDLRCPIEQAEQLYVWLKKLGKEALFVRFPDEGHEMSRSGKPRHRLERFNLLLDWFGAYLKDEPPSRHAEMVSWWSRRAAVTP